MTNKELENWAESLLGGFGWTKDVMKQAARGVLALLAKDTARGGWQPIETVPENESVLIYLPNWEHYGPAIYRAILVNMGTGKRWHTTGWSVGRDLSPNVQPTHWMPLPPAPETQP